MNMRILQISSLQTSVPHMSWNNFLLQVQIYPMDMIIEPSFSEKKGNLNISDDV